MTDTVNEALNPMKDIETVSALNRFGLGPAPGEPARVADDPRAWLQAQIQAQKTPKALKSFPSSAEVLEAIHTARTAGAEALQKETRKAYRASYTREIIARAQHMSVTETPFAERMVLFWSNHFTVSRTKAIIGPAIPAYEREAIRPHVFGKFTDMLIAVCRHPVMLSYLDNQFSVGENSRAGKRRRRRTGSDKTINENLAREILELHTLGVNGGYTQTDVIELAKTITGWSHGGARLRFEKAPIHGGFEFKDIFHEPGTKTVLGKRYKEDGDAEGIAVLKDLAEHPATARFIATKLVRHFVADDPPAESIEQIAAVFRKTDGDLAAVSRALVELDSAWRAPLAKTKSHYEYVVSVNRVMGNTALRPQHILRPLTEMGQIPYSAPSPAGWSDEASAWVAPEALMRRIEWVHRFSASLSAGRTPAAELERLLGPVASETLRREVQRAPSGKEAMTLVLASAEFQRR